jgi:hypothetical protein
MEIILQGKGTYGRDWDGMVEADSLQLFQIKRLVGSRSVVALFRKIVKIMNGAGSPVRLPEWLAPADLDIGDFMQVVVAMVAMSKGRQLQRTYACPHCGSNQPRVVDVISVFKPGAPAVPGGSAEVEDGEGGMVRCRNVRIRDFLEVHAASELLMSESWKPGPGGGKPALDLAYVKRAYGNAFPVLDEEDLDDFSDQLVEVGLVAAAVSRAGANGEEAKDAFPKRLAWLFGLKGEALGLFSRLQDSVAGLSATMDSDYETKCTDCGKGFKGEVGVEDYFFDSRWISSTRWSAA